MGIVEEGQRVFDMEIEALMCTRRNLGKEFEQIVHVICDCKGKLVLTGMGKPGHIAVKLAATFSSLGTPSFYLHPAEAMHGDLGVLAKEDVVIALSYSGESDEIVHILRTIKQIGAKLIGITRNASSTLARMADLVQILPEFEEACHLGLAPTSSTTAFLCYGDALAVAVSALRGFQDTDFAFLHPAGALGKKLNLFVRDLMLTGEKNAIIYENAMLKDAVVELSQKGLGMVAIVDEDYIVQGIITDGDLRRLIENGADVYNLKVSDVMTRQPIVSSPDISVVQALETMKERNVSCMPVVIDNRLVGTIRLQNIISLGIFG